MAVSSRVQTTFTANANGLVAGTKRASTALENMQRSLFGLNRQMNGLIAIQGLQLFAGITRGATYALGAVTNLSRSIAGEITKAVNSAVDLGEETSKSFVVFGDAADKIQEFAISAARIGLSETAALQATGTFGNLFRAMGVGQGQAAEYAQTMTQLSADLASFSNTSVDEAVLAVGAALRGEAEPIRRFGVLLNDATLKNEALAQGLIKSAKGSLDPATKAMAAYQLILRQTAIAQGDFARTSDGMANLQRIVSAQASNLVTEVGGAFEGLFTSTVAVLSEILTAAGPFIRDLAQGLGGALAGVADGIRQLAAPIAGFVNQLDGVRVGEQIAAAMFDAVEYAASWADTLYGFFASIVGSGSDSASTWTTLASVWAGIWETASRVFSFAQGVFYAAGGMLTAIVTFFAGIYDRFLAAVDYIPGVDTTEAAAAASAYTESLQRSTQDYFGKAGASFGDAFGSQVADAASSGVGPMQSVIQDLRNTIANQKKQLDESAAATAESISTAGRNAADAITSASTKPQLAGIDARSSEGVNYILSQLAGDREGKAIERQQLEVQRGILAATRNNQVQTNVVVANI